MPGKKRLCVRTEDKKRVVDMINKDFTNKRILSEICKDSNTNVRLYFTDSRIDEIRKFVSINPEYPNITWEKMTQSEQDEALNWAVEKGVNGDDFANAYRFSSPNGIKLIAAHKIKGEESKEYVQITEEENSNTDSNFFSIAQRYALNDYMDNALLYFAKVHRSIIKDLQLRIEIIGRDSDGDIYKYSPKWYEEK